MSVSARAGLEAPGSQPASPATVGASLSASQRSSQPTSSIRTSSSVSSGSPSSSVMYPTLPPRLVGGDSRTGSVDNGGTAPARRPSPYPGLLQVLTVDACRNEVLAGADELADWMRSQPSSFPLQPQPGDQPSLTRVSQWAVGAPQYRQGAASQFLTAGDYFLVSQALSLGYTVVTHEEPAPLGKNRIKIPDACDAVGVRWIAPWRMLRDEGARFDLRP